MRSAWVKPFAVLALLTLAACARGEPATTDTAAENLKAARAFIAKNADEPGVRTLPSGVQYKVVASGPATGEHPDGNDLVSVHYEGTLTDGTVFDSSFQRGAPAVFTLDQVIPGWSSAVQAMRPGDEWIVYVPPELGYGEEDKGDIPPNSALVFRLQLIGVARNAGDAPPAGATAV